MCCGNPRTEEWPSRVRSRAPLAASHSRTVLSAEADARVAPSCENLTTTTPRVCPRSVVCSLRGRADDPGVETMVQCRQADSRAVQASQSLSAGGTRGASMVQALHVLYA